MELRISGVSYMCWMDFHNAIPRDFVLWVFMCPINVSLFCDHLYCTGYHAQGYHAFTTTARLPRLCIYPGYHARRPGGGIGGEQLVT